MTTFEKLGDDRGIARAMAALGVCETIEDHPDKATRLMSDALGLAKRAGDLYSVPSIASNLAVAAVAQDPVSAAELSLRQLMSPERSGTESC